MPFQQQAGLRSFAEFAAVIADISILEGCSMLLAVPAHVHTVSAHLSGLLESHRHHSFSWVYLALRGALLWMPPPPLAPSAIAP